MPNSKILFQTQFQIKGLALKKKKIQRDRPEGYHLSHPKEILEKIIEKSNRDSFSHLSFGESGKKWDLIRILIK